MDHTDTIIAEGHRGMAEELAQQIPSAIVLPSEKLCSDSIHSFIDINSIKELSIAIYIQNAPSGNPSDWLEQELLAAVAFSRHVIHRMHQNSTICFLCMKPHSCDTQEIIEWSVAYAALQSLIRNLRREWLGRINVHLHDKTMTCNEWSTHLKK